MLSKASNCFCRWLIKNHQGLQCSHCLKICLYFQLFWDPLQNVLKVMEVSTYSQKSSQRNVVEKSWIYLYLYKGEHSINLRSYTSCHLLQKIWRYKYNFAWRCEIIPSFYILTQLASEYNWKNNWNNWLLIKSKSTNFSYINRVQASCYTVF